MSVVIDMDMPDNCENCPCSAGYGCAVTDEIMRTKDMESGRSSDCPIKAELPAKHGRLIDYDDLSKLVCEDFGVFLSRLDLKTPATVIEAEDE